MRGNRVFALLLLILPAGAIPSRAEGEPAGESVEALRGADAYATNEIFLPDIYSLKRKIQWEEGGGFKIVRSEHFEVIVRTGEEELGLRVAGIAEPWHKELSARLGAPPDSTPLGRIPLIAYTSLPRFQETNTIPGILPEGVQGFFEFVKGRIVLPHTGSNILLEHVTRHEIVHALVFAIVERSYKEYKDLLHASRDRRGDWNKLGGHARNIAKHSPHGTFPRFWREALDPKELEIGLPNRQAVEASAEGRALLAPRIYVGVPPGDSGSVHGPLTVSIQVVGEERLAALLEPEAFDSLAAALTRVPDSARLVIRRIEREHHWDFTPRTVILLDQRAVQAAGDTAAVRSAIARALEPVEGRWAVRRPELALLAPPSPTSDALAASTAPLLPAYGMLSSVRMTAAPTPWPPPEERYSAAEDALFQWHQRGIKPRLLPIALNEGAAEYFGSDWDALEEMVLRDALYSNRLIPLDHLGPQYGYLVYVEGESFLRFLTRTYGEESLSLLIKSVYLGPTLSDATRAIFGKDVAELSDDWEEDLRRQFFPHYADALPTEAWATRLTDGRFDTVPRASGTRTVFKRARRGRIEIVLQEAAAPGQGGGVTDRILARDQRPGNESLHILESGLDIRGDRIAFGVQSRGKDVLRVIDLPSGKTRHEFGWDDILSITGVSIAPDGRRAALTALDEKGHTDLFIASLETDSLARITEDIYEESTPDWDEGGILFSSDRESHGSHDLFRFDPDVAGSRIERLTTTAWNETEPAWLPDGTGFLALDDRDGVANVTLHDLAGGGSRFVTRDRIGVAHMSVGSDRLVCSAFNGLRQRIWEAPLDSLLAPLPAGEDSLRGEPTLAAADDSLADDPTLAAGDDSLAGEPTLAAGDDSLTGEPTLAAAPATRDSAGRSPGGPDPVEVPHNSPWHPFPPPPHEIVPYRPRYGPDLLFLNATSITSGAYIGFSDLLSNRQIAVILGSNGGTSQSFFKFLNLGVVYNNLEGRTDWRVGFLRTGNEFLTAEEGFFFERDTGVLFGMTHPIDRYRSVTWNVITSAVTREIPGKDDDHTAEVALQTVLGHDTAVPDDYGYGYGDGTLTSLLLSLDYRATQPTGWRSATAIYDLRHYLPIAGRTFLAVRASYGISSGRVPDRIRLGGSWTLRGFPFNELQGDRFALGNLELRFPMPVLVSLGPFPIVRALQGAVFGDVGDAWFKSRGMSLKGSVGFGFRMGLAGSVFRCDISKIYDRARGGFENGSRADFFIGYNF